jgi:enoyl-CoA hydratase/carnithine racemase
MAKPPRALKVTRQLIKGDLAALFARIDEEERLILAALASREAQEAVTAIVERRPPVFQ